MRPFQLLRQDYINYFLGDSACFYRTNDQEEQKLLRVKSLAHALLKYRNKIPERRKNEMFKSLEELLGVEKLSERHLEICLTLYQKKRHRVETYGPRVVSELLRESKKINISMSKLAHLRKLQEAYSRSPLCYCRNCTEIEYEGSRVDRLVKDFIMSWRGNCLSDGLHTQN